MFRLQEQESEVGLFQHRDIPMLSVHIRASEFWRAHIVREVTEDGQMEGQGAEEHGARRQQARLRIL